MVTEKLFHILKRCCENLRLMFSSKLYLDLDFDNSFHKDGAKVEEIATPELSVSRVPFTVTVVGRHMQNRF